MEKLYSKYRKDVAIIGIAANEGRDIVVTFLQEHPRSYPVVLASENQMPRVYRTTFCPPYIVIDRDGMIVSAMERQQGFGNLQKMLKKAGLQTD